MNIATFLIAFHKQAFPYKKANPLVIGKTDEDMKYLAYIILFFLIVAYLSSCAVVHESSPKQSAVPDTTKADSLSTAKNKDKEIGSVVIIFLFMVLVIIKIQLYH